MTKLATFRYEHLVCICQTTPFPDRSSPVSLEYEVYSPEFRGEYILMSHESYGL